MVDIIVLNLIIVTIKVWILSVFVHELAHILYYRWRVGKFPTVWIEDWAICVGTPHQVNKLKPLHRREFYIAGVISGLLCYTLLPVPLLGAVASIPYLLGCSWDFKRFCE